MTILSCPIHSSSFRSWKVVAGSFEVRLCVQERTFDGLEKNKRIIHKMRYLDTDHAPYRIIYSCNPLDYEPEFMKQKVSHKEAKKKQRQVLAAANSLHEIMGDWKTIISRWDASIFPKNDEWLTAEYWGKLYDLFSRSSSEETTTVLKTKQDINGESGAVKERIHFSSSSSREPTEDDGALKQNNSWPLDTYDMFIVRTMCLLNWHRPIETFIYLVVLISFSRLGIMDFLILSLITLPIFFIPLRQSMDSHELEEYERKLSQLEELLGWKSPRHVISSIGFFILLDYVVSLLLPQWDLLNILKPILVPVFVLCILYTGLIHLLNTLIEQRHHHNYDGYKESVTATEEVIEDGERAEENSLNLEPKGGDETEGDAQRNALRDELTPKGPFSKIITHCIEFSSKSNGWVLRQKQRNGLEVYEKQSSYSKRTALLTIANIPNANVGTLQHLLLDDPDFEDDKSSYAYQYDKLLSSRASVGALGVNELLVLTRYKTVHWGVAPREVLSWVSCANLFTPSQQEALGLRDINNNKNKNNDNNGKELLAFSQCAVVCSDDMYLLPESIASNEYERAKVFVYLIMGLEEADGSLTLHTCHDVDPKGRIPKMFQDQINKQYIAKAEAIMNLVSKIGPKPNMLKPYVNRRDFYPFLSAPSSRNNVELDFGGAVDKKCQETSPSPQPAPSVVTVPKDEAKRIAKRFVQELFLREWSLHHEKKGISLWTTTTPWTDKKAVKTVVFIPDVALGDVDAVLGNVSLAPKLDLTIEQKVVVKKESDALTVLCTTFHSPMIGVAAREMVTREAPAYYPTLDECSTLGLPCTGQAAEHSVLLLVGEDATEEMPTNSKYQRGRAFLFGILAEETQDEHGVKGVRLTRCVAADPGGSMPTVIVNAVVSLQLENTACIAKYIKRHAIIASSNEPK